MVSAIDNLCFAWNGDYDSLKSFLSKDLNLVGTWEQPGGDKKVFKSSNILISWRRNKNLLHLEGAKAGKIIQLLCSKMCQNDAESVVVNDSVNEAVVVNDPDNPCETDLQSRVYRSSAMEHIEELKAGQAVNTEAIQSLSDSLIHITEVLANIQENKNKSRQNTEVQTESEPKNMQPRKIAGQEPNNKENISETNEASEPNIPNADESPVQNNKIGQSKAKADDQPNAVHESKSDEYLNYLLKTIKELKEENNLLAERATNVSYVMTDLNTKLKDLENEKASLLTVIKILQLEQVHETSHGHMDWKSSRKSVLKHGSGERETTVKGRQPLETSNRYSALQIVESDDDIGVSEQDQNRCSGSIIDLGSPDNSRDKRCKTFRQGEQPDGKFDNGSQDGNKRRETKFKNNREVRKQHRQDRDLKNGTPEYRRQDFQSNHNKAAVVIGDSMIKQIDCKRLQRAANGQYSRGMRIRKETYRGARVDAMKHHVKPCLTSKPDRIILHIGTNDIGSTKDEKEIIKGIGDICEVIKQDSPNTKIALSTLVIRADKPDYKAKVQKVNKELAELCEYKNYDLIKHENIESRHLNPYGIHLNRHGSSVMASNFLSYLNNIKDN